MIGVGILAGPVVVRGRPNNPGWTGFIVIDKSHISIHTFDKGSRISVDVFSCQPFDANDVSGYIEWKLKLTRLNIRLFTRTETPS